MSVINPSLVATDKTDGCLRTLSFAHSMSVRDHHADEPTFVVTKRNNIASHLFHLLTDIPFIPCTNPSSLKMDVWLMISCVLLWNCFIDQSVGLTTLRYVPERDIREPFARWRGLFSLPNFAAPWLASVGCLA